MAQLDAFLASLERFVRERLIPAEEAVAAADRIPDDLRRAMADLGLFGLSIPEPYGGLGLTMEEEVRALFVLGQASPAYRALWSLNVGGGSQGLVTSGTEAQRARYLPRMASGELLAAFALTEPEAGSDAVSLAMTARRDGAGWVLDGIKRYVVNGPDADVYVVMARSDPASTGAGGVSSFLVERSVPGVLPGPAHRMMGLSGSHVADLELRGCRVPADALLGGVEGRGFRIAMQSIDKARLHVAALCVGMAARMLDEALRHALARRQFGERIADFQLVQAMLADCRTELHAARCMVVEAAQARDAGEDVSTAVACCKLYSAEMCTRVADRAVQIHGGAGYIRGAAAERFYRDARVFRILDGTSEIQRMVIARGMMRAR